jgi:hypothetical protein
MPAYRRRLESAILVAFSCGTAFQEARPSAPILQRCALGTFVSYQLAAVS